MTSYRIDNDLHLHSRISTCSNDPEQTEQRLLRYAQENGLRRICLTNHFWDERVPGACESYAVQNYAHICAALPLPQAKGIEFLFGCETEMDKHLTLGLSQERMDDFDFIALPTTHLHLTGFTIDESDGTPARRAQVYVRRFEAALKLSLPFARVGLAHLTADKIDPASPKAHLKVLERIPDEEFAGLFRETAARGAGVELNFNVFSYAPEELDAALRPYRIAADCGCKFYFGSDAHHVDRLLAAPKNFARIAQLLELREEQKFIPEKRKA